MSIDGHRRILEIEPKSIHQRTPIFIGSNEKVKRVKAFLEEYERVTE